MMALALQIRRFTIENRPVVLLTPTRTRLPRALQAGFVALSLGGCYTGRLVPTPSACSVSLNPPERLVLSDGRLVLVQPTAYATSRQGEILIAGFPTLVGVNSSHVTAGNALGVVVSGNSAARVVESPIDVRTMGLLKALGRPTGGWDVFIAEGASPTSKDTIARLWHGVYDGHRWESLNQVPVPVGMLLLAFGASDPIRVRDTVFWALRVRNPEDHTTNAVLLRYTASSWSSEIVPTREAVYLALTHSVGEGLQLAVVAPDASEQRDENSLFVWTASPAWAMHRRISFGAVDGPAHYPTYAGGNPPVLTWYADIDVEERREVRTLHPLQPHHDSSTVIEPRLADRVPASALRLVNGVHVWVLRSENGDDSQLRVVFSTDSVGGGRTFPSPYRTSIRALENDRSEIVIIGGVEDKGPYPVTALVRVRVNCL